MLFGKNVKKLESLLEKAKEKQDYTGMAKYYYKLGNVYKNEKSMVKALYYLNCFDDLVGGENSLYEKFSKKDDKAMEWVDDLEMEMEEPIYVKKLQEQVVEKSEKLSVMQKLQWVLLTMSRFCVLFEQISKLPGFEGFEKLEEIVTYFSQGIYGETDEEKDDEASDFGEQIDDVFDSILMSDYTKRIELVNQKYFAPADLGTDGQFWFSMGYWFLESFVYDGKEEDIEMEFVTCGILADYYYRTLDIRGTDDIEGEEKVQEEVKRIFSDYTFVLEEPDQERFQERMEKYKKIMLI